MDITTLLDNKYVIGVASGVGSVFLTLLTQQVHNKRGLFTYFVNHFRVGVSSDDTVFGSVRVTWNGNTVANLYSSTVELTNESMKDFEGVVVRAFTNDTILLTERTEIVGTTHIVEWTDAFKKRVRSHPRTKGIRRTSRFTFTQAGLLGPGDEPWPSGPFSFS